MSTSSASSWSSARAELRAVGLGSAGRLAKNLLGSGVAQLLHLRVNALAVRRNACIAVNHALVCTHTGQALVFQGRRAWCIILDFRSAPRRRGSPMERIHPEIRNSGDSALFQLSGYFDFGRRLPGRNRRPVSSSIHARKPSSPSGRPMLSAARRRANSSGRGASARRSAKSGKRSSTGARGDPVVFAGEMRARARPAPVPRPLDEARAHRVERHVTQRRRKMRLVHDHRTETALPEIPVAAPRVNGAG